METFTFLAPVAGIVALLFAFILSGRVSKEDEGTDRMKEIAQAIREGANAFLMAEYKILVIFVIILFILIGVGLKSWTTAAAFIVGALFSTAAATRPLAA